MQDLDAHVCKEIWMKRGRKKLDRERAEVGSIARKEDARGESVEDD